MASLYNRGPVQWIKFYPPGQSTPCRKSLGQIDPALAKLIRRRLDLELQLRRPDLQSVELPESLVQALGGPSPLETLSSTPTIIAPPITEPIFALPPPATSPPSPAIREFLTEFVAYIRAENDPHHATNKIGCLKKYFGSDLLGCADGKPAVFTGQTLADVDVSEIARLLDALTAAKKPSDITATRSTRSTNSR